MYRRNKIVISSDWHFNERCPHWPEKDFIETESVDPTRGDHICVLCIGMSVAASKPKTSVRRPSGT